MAHLGEVGDVTLAILAGGRGERMGRGKGELMIRGRGVLEFILDGIGWAGPTLLVTGPGRERPRGWERFDREVVDEAEGEGPLRGVLTGLQASATDTTVFLTVDMPGVGWEQVNFLVRRIGDGARRGGESRREEIAAEGPRMSGEKKREGAGETGAGALGVMLERVEGGGLRLEPFPCAMRKEAAGIIRARLERGERSVGRLRAEPGFLVVRTPEAWARGVWENLNTPADFEGFLKRAGVE